MRFFEATMHHLGELMREQIAIHVTEKPFSKKKCKHRSDVTKGRFGIIHLYKKKHGWMFLKIQAI